MRLSEPDQRASSLRAFLEQSGFFETPAYELITTNPGLMQARIGLLGLAASVGMDGWTAVGHLLGKEAVAAMYPPRQSGGQPGLLIVALGRDTVSRGKFIDAAATAAGLVKGGRPDPATSTTVDGRTVFTAGELRYCVDGEALLISGDADLVRSALGARWGSIPSMAVSGDLDAAEAAAPPDAFIVGALDARAMVRLAASEGNPEFWRFENPLGGFMFGGWADSLRQASAAMAWITERADGLAMTLRIDRDRDAPAGRTGFGLPALAGSIDLSSLRLPRQVASLSMGRDWASLFSDREEILTVAGASQVAAFAATMTTLMGNFDFTEDFLPRVNGPIRVLLERQDFSEAAYAPSPRLPAFAMVAPLKGASEEMLRQRLMSGSQMALSFINYDAAQKQQPGFLMGLGEHRGVTILKGTYPPPGAGAGLSMMAPGGSGGSSSPDADRRPDEDDADPRGAGE
ncbi:MAG TPA: hypothetical protein PKU91_09265, partial [Phycisphaerales bacterium]|nr:hypothetical protein [Phycisphaerales bacterium]